MPMWKCISAMYFIAPSEVSESPPQGVTVSVAVFVATVAGVLAVAAVVFGVVGFTLGMLSGVHYSNKRQPSQAIASTQSQPSPASSVGPEASPRGGPEYEEISLQEVKDIHLVDNTAYGCKST